MLRWLAHILTPGHRSAPPARSADSQALTRLEELLRTPGKAHHTTLIALAQAISKEDFITTVHCPSIVGSSIRDGELNAPRGQTKDILMNSTFQFSPAQISAFLEGEAIEQTIFLLRKEVNRLTDNNPSCFTIGRAKSNDIRIVDFAISRKHATIRQRPDGYYIEDCNSRNGTRVNARSIRTKPEQLFDRDVITLGRYEFTFLLPETLHERLNRVRIVS